MTRLRNPECLWERPNDAGMFDRFEVESRMGQVSEPLELLPGGLANLNVRVGAGRVLRVYRRDPLALAVEATLLRRPWKNVRTPEVLASGEDFLVLEYVAHAPLSDEVEQAEAVGSALAEIHALAFPRAGLLNATLDMGMPYPDVIGTFSDYALSQLDRAPSGVAAEIRPRVEALLVAHADTMRHLARASVLLHGDFKVSNLKWTERGQLLVLDWEFAYSGPCLMDIGQLIRWGAPPSFIEGFTRGYRDHGGALPEDWQKWAAAFDLFNLAGLLAGSGPGSRRATDVARRIVETLGALR
ncbi:MAG TPA: phosphotransferase [Gemmatimonadaceae bacterium]|jgi:Phosphotransferase enzyme family.